MKAGRVQGLEGRPRTWLSLTRSGRRAFERHTAALLEIAAGNGIDSQVHTPVSER